MEEIIQSTLQSDCTSIFFVCAAEPDLLMVFRVIHYALLPSTSILIMSEWL